MQAKTADESYWAIVARCLVRFHGFSTLAAKAKARSFREALKSAPRTVRADAVYHENPFNVASRLAGRQLDFADHAQEFEELVAATTADHGPRKRHA